MNRFIGRKRAGFIRFTFEKKQQYFKEVSIMSLDIQEILYSSGWQEGVETAIARGLFRDQYQVLVLVTSESGGTVRTDEGIPSRCAGIFRRHGLIEEARCDYFWLLEFLSSEPDRDAMERIIANVNMRKRLQVITDLHQYFYDEGRSSSFLRQIVSGLERINAGIPLVLAVRPEALKWVSRTIGMRNVLYLTDGSRTVHEGIVPDYGSFESAGTAGPAGSAMTGGRDETSKTGPSLIGGGDPGRWKDPGKDDRTSQRALPASEWIRKTGSSLIGGRVPGRRPGPEKEDSIRQQAFPEPQWYRKNPGLLDFEVRRVRKSCSNAADPNIYFLKNDGHAFWLFSYPLHGEVCKVMIIYGAGFPDTYPDNISIIPLKPALGQFQRMHTGIPFRYSAEFQREVVSIGVSRDQIPAGWGFAETAWKKFYSAVEHNNSIERKGYTFAGIRPWD